MGLLSARSNFHTCKDFKKVEIKKEFVTKNNVGLLIHVKLVFGYPNFGGNNSTDTPIFLKKQYFGHIM